MNGRERAKALQDDWKSQVAGAPVGIGTRIVVGEKEPTELS